MKSVSSSRADPGPRPGAMVLDVTLQELDPEIAAAVREIDFDGLSADNLATYRAGMRSFPLSDKVIRTDVTVPGDPAVTIRVHRAADAADGPLPCLYSMHGGGYVLGTYAIDDARFDQWCPLLGVVGVSVEYRLAPETPYPGPLEDCYRGLEWTFEHAEELGIDPTMVGVMGISAGGGLAASLALLARDRGKLSIAFQMLDCPMLDDRQQTPSIQQDGLKVWSRESNVFGWRSYLGALYGSHDVPYTAAPARCPDLSGLPPAFVSVGTVDGFRDEDIDYALRLNQAGVACELHVYPGAGHGYQAAVGSRIAQQSSRDVLGWLEHQLSKG